MFPMIPKVESKQKSYYTIFCWENKKVGKAKVEEKLQQTLKDKIL